MLDEHGGRRRYVPVQSLRVGEHRDRPDEFEGDGYERVLTTTVKGPDGSTAPAHIHVLRGRG